MDKIQQLKVIFEDLRYHGAIKTQKDFAALLGINEGNLSKALKGDERYLTDSLLSKAAAASRNIPEDDAATGSSVIVLPASARGGTIADFMDSVHEYECERIVSPIKTAEYAMQVVGNSMEPEFPNGSRILMKRVNEEIYIEWGKVYVLDTDNGALLKKVRKTDDPTVIECISLNPEYDTFTINVQYIHGWYRVLMVLALK